MPYRIGVELGHRSDRLTMHVGNRLVGLGLTVLASPGLWFAWRESWAFGSSTSRLQRFNSKLFGKVDQLVAQVERRADQARNAVGETRDLVDELKQTLRDSATDRVAERVASLPEIDNLEQRLASAMERADGLVQRSTAAAELIEQLLVALADFASERDVDLKRSSELMASIQSVRESLGNASEQPLRGSESSGRDSPESGVAGQSPADHEAFARHRRQAGCRTESDGRSSVARLDETTTRLGQLQNTDKVRGFSGVSSCSCCSSPGRVRASIACWSTAGGSSGHHGWGDAPPWTGTTTRSSFSERQNRVDAENRPVVVAREVGG